jgi:hypothetical protein
VAVQVVASRAVLSSTELVRQYLSFDELNQF